MFSFLFGMEGLKLKVIIRKKKNGFESKLSQKKNIIWKKKKKKVNGINS